MATLRAWYLYSKTPPMSINLLSRFRIRVEALSPQSPGRLSIGRFNHIKNLIIGQIPLLRIHMCRCSGVFVFIKSLIGTRSRTVSTLCTRGFSIAGLPEISTAITSPLVFAASLSLGNLLASLYTSLA